MRLTEKKAKKKKRKENKTKQKQKKSETKNERKRWLKIIKGTKLRSNSKQLPGQDWWRTQFYYLSLSSVIYDWPDDRCDVRRYVRHDHWWYLVEVKLSVRKFHVPDLLNEIALGANVCNHMWLTYQLHVSNVWNPNLNKWKFCTCERVWTTCGSHASDIGKRCEIKSHVKRKYNYKDLI